LKLITGTRRAFVRLLAVLLCVFLATLDGALAATVAGTIPGQLSVSESGAATYTISIPAPPGTGGIEPKLSLNYNSQGGNGLLGVGWSLGGLSAIHRCPKTLVQDGVKGGINYDANDRYCLDGQRLVAVTGTYGADGTEYRTERESFTKVVSYGAAGNGPAWWKVWTKSGQIMEYGNTADSRIEAQGKASARVWALNKLTDTKSNYLTITYTEDNPNGDFYPNRIDYTGNASAGLSPNSSARFTYETRADNTSEFYVGGSVIKTLKRLLKVQSYQGETVVGEQRLVYANGASPNNASRLTSITQCDGADNCLPATTIQWQTATGSQGFAAATGWSGIQPGTMLFIADANGDGLGDLLSYQASQGSGETITPPSVKVSFSTGSGFGSPVFSSQLNNGVVAGFGDVNGDGKADIVFSDGMVKLSTGAGFAAPAYWYVQPGSMLFIADANGDGYGDLLAYQARTETTPPSISVSYSNGSRFLAPSFSTQISTWDAVAGFGDANGDGLADIVQSDGLVRLSTGTGFASPQGWPVQAGSMIQLAEGSAMSYNPGDTGGSVPPSFVVSYSNGGGFVSPITISQLGWSVVTGYGDINGDGRPDIVQSDGVVRLATQPTPDLVTSITSGLGAITAVTYKPQTDGTVYAADTGAVYPIQELKKQGPQQLVSSVSQSNGIGGTIISNYFYRGGRLHLNGGGYLGFRQVESADAASGIKTITTARQDYPYQGLPSSIVTQTSGGTVLKRVTNTWADQLLTPAAGSGGKWHKSQLTQSVEESFELNGAAVTTVTTASQYDDWGNPTQIVVGTGDGYSKTTTNTYINNVGSWLLGRLTRSTVASTAPAPTPLPPPPPPPPTITLTSVSPNGGLTTGGTTITLTGTGFAIGTTVTIGGVAATGCTVVNGTSMTCVTPANTVGSKNVVATKGTESATLTNGFIYAAALALSAVSPTSGTTAGGTAITLTGQAFAAGATVTVGGVAATGCTVPSSTSMNCITPAGTAGAKNVVVNSGGSSATLTNGFTYVTPLSLTAVSPSSGQTMGGTTIALTGTAFAAGATVTIGGVAATSCSVASSTYMTCVTPAGTAGAKNVVVTSGGSNATLVSGYTYVAATASATPSPFSFAYSCPTSYGTVTFRNTSTIASLRINSIGVSGAPFYHGEWYFGSETNYVNGYGTCVAGNTLAPNATCTIKLTFYSFGGGQVNGTLSVTHNGSGGQTSVPLSGACQGM
jgi:hypothetical protein